MPHQPNSRPPPLPRAALLSALLLALLLAPPTAAAPLPVPLSTAPSGAQQQPQQQPQRQRGSFWFRTLRVAGGGGLRRLLMPPVPPQCAYTGLNLQMQCSDDLRNATTEMLGYPTTDLASLAPTVSTKQLGAFLNKRRTPPSAQCCEAASAFVNLYCLCAPAMRDEFEEFVHWEQLQEIAHYLGKRCVEVNRPLTLYMDNNCPEHPI